ncbi:hypothetical protein PanWU01x14_136050 [Parasponia andersonii]|uniref:Retrotransposon Copia-like N-terminal domain-containing protein n=1 Tax=Parasponia andersonii TaxID=3476 RepID=A0A2P5CNR5_PARAD|nr:hypothetical protein PanWU01x14_136050 [Parasponia andersonii]
MVGPTQNLSFLYSLVPLALKLDRNNFAFWRSPILPMVQAQDFEGFLLSTHPCQAQYISLQDG